jgi:hypothetical protein
MWFLDCDRWARSTRSTCRSAATPWMTRRAEALESVAERAPSAESAEGGEGVKSAARFKICWMEERGGPSIALKVKTLQLVVV